MSKAAEKQRQYYTETASEYDRLHIHAGDEHETALTYISMFIDRLSINSILDVGAGTGRAMLHFCNRHPHLSVSGVEAVPAMIARAVNHGIAPGSILEGSALCLPFPDNHFDAVCAFALLHHVKEPERAVSEMCRVARRAVFISDSNRFGMGGIIARHLKLSLYAARLWPLANLVKTKGRGYTISKDDGLAYSYSVYDDLRQLQQWSDRVLILPTSPPSSTSLFHPLLTTPHLLVCAFNQ